MKQTTLHGKPIKVGDKVWTIQSGWTEVIDIDKNKFDDLLFLVTPDYSYDEKGHLFGGDEHPSLFWKEQTFVL